MEQKTKNQKSIKTVLIAVMVLLVAVPLTVSLIVSSINTLKSAKSSSNEINSAQALYIREQVVTTLEKNMQALKAVAASPAVIEFVKNGGTEAEEAALNRQLAQLDASFEDGNVTAISGADGMQVLKSSGKLVDVSEREYFQKAIGGSDYASDMQVSKSNGTRIATFSTPVIDASGKVVGIVQRNYDLNCFHEILAEAVTEEQQEIVLVDRTGSVIAHSGHEISPDEPEDQSMNEFYTDSRGDKLSGTYETTWGGNTWFVSWEKEYRTGWVVASCRVEAVALKTATTTMILMIVVGAIAVVVGILIAIFMSRSFTIPLKDIGESLSALADGRFVKIDKHQDRKDEFGTMVAETNSLIDTLSSIVDNIKASAVNVNEESVELADTADQISQTADDVSNAVQDIAHGATQQADEVQSANNNTITISDNIQRVTDNADEVSKLADQMNENSRESAAQLDKLKKSSEEMSQAIDEISEKIGATSDAVSRISGKVEAINSIASQTNLLALNASIEAARAGEAGRGFAVVAEEIGNLADESSKAADEIRDEMTRLLNESQSAVAKANDVNETTKEQKEIIEATVASISTLIEEIETSVSEIGNISDSAQACEDSKGVIVDAMSSLSSISEENAASCEETSASMEELNATVNTLAAAADKLRHISDGLIKEMKFFK